MKSQEETMVIQKIQTDQLVEKVERMKVRHIEKMQALKLSWQDREKELQA